MNTEILTERYKSLQVCVPDINAACDALVECFSSGGKLLLCGNGGSCADCEHISGELLKGFLSKRPLATPQYKAIADKGGEALARTLQEGLPAIPLTSFTALSTAYANDAEPKYTFAQLTLALGKPGDVLLGITTSGSAENVRAAFATASATGIKTIALTGEKGKGLKEICDIVISAPESETYKVQELHLPIYHYICACTEERMFGSCVNCT